MEPFRITIMYRMGFFNYTDRHDSLQKEIVRNISIIFSRILFPKNNKSNSFFRKIIKRLFDKYLWNNISINNIKF